MRRLCLLLACLVLAAGCAGASDPADDAGAAGLTEAPEPTATRSPEVVPTDEAEPTTPDEPAGDGLLAFTAPLLDGGQLDASSLEGRDVVLWFWAPW